MNEPGALIRLPLVPLFFVMPVLTPWWRRRRAGLARPTVVRET